MTTAQKHSVRLLLIGLAGTFHHGDCVGADADAHDIALAEGFAIIIRPPLGATQRARKSDASFIHEPKPYLDRNKDIVRATEGTRRR